MVQHQMLFAYSESEDGKQLTVSCVQGPDALYVSSLPGWFLQPQLNTDWIHRVGVNKLVLFLYTCPCCIDSFAKVCFIKMSSVSVPCLFLHNLNLRWKCSGGSV